MKINHLVQMVKGWFVGEFKPSAFSTGSCEVAVKNYLRGDNEKEHYHKLATEVTLVLSGQVKMLDKIWTDGDIITIFPEEVTAFEALSDATLVVVKIPGALNDKYFLSED